MANQKTEAELYAAIKATEKKQRNCTVEMDEGPNPVAEATMVKLIDEWWVLCVEAAERFNLALPDGPDNLPAVLPDDWIPLHEWMDKMEIQSRN